MTLATVNVKQFCTLDSVSPTIHLGSQFAIGQLYSGGGKAFNRRGIAEFDLSSLVGWTGISAILYGEAGYPYNGPFGATLREVLEAFTDSQACWNERVTGTAWANLGAEVPTSATDTNKVAFTTPSAVGFQNLVTGMGTLVQSRVGGTLRFHIRSNNEAPGYDLFVSFGSLQLLVTGTAPPVKGWAQML